MFTTKSSSIFIYIAVLIVTLFLNKKIKNKKNIYIIVLPLSVLAAFRYGSGVDFFAYKDIFESLKGVSDLNDLLSHYQEFGNVLIYKLSDIIFGNYQGMFFIFSYLTNVFILKGIYKYKDDLSTSISLFIYFVILYFVSFNIIRQVLAIAIVFSSLKYIEKRNFLIFSIYIIIASLFHKTAIFSIMFYFLNFKKNRGIKQVIFFLIYVSFIAVMLFYPKLIIETLKLFNIYNSYIDSGDNRSSFGYLFYMIPPLILILTYIFLTNKKEKKMYLYLINIYILTIPFQLLGNIVRYSERVALYTRSVEIILISLILSRLSKKINLKYFALVWYVLYFIIMIIILNANGVLPYINKK